MLSLVLHFLLVHGECWVFGGKVGIERSKLAIDVLYSTIEKRMWSAGGDFKFTEAPPHHTLQ